ncbi:MAG: hypothetical protein FJ044_04755 [Candidatus Cloacimonetes bacterium]|nr:hypothetical protein [Candidatus Cloacimonadota bacterium]
MLTHPSQKATAGLLRRSPPNQQAKAGQRRAVPQNLTSRQKIVEYTLGTLKIKGFFKKLENGDKGDGTEGEK